MFNPPPAIAMKRRSSTVLPFIFQTPSKRRSRVRNVGVNVGTIWKSKKTLIFQHNMADGVGFEPTKGFHLWRFSRPLPSTTRPPVRAEQCEIKAANASRARAPNNAPQERARERAINQDQKRAQFPPQSRGPLTLEMR
jgi:hypothetical protein